MSEKKLTRLAGELVLASFIVLFQELTLIRWMGGQIRVLAYFPNLILISAFLGLGLGCLRAREKSLLWFWPLSLLLLGSACWGMSFIVFTQQAGTEHLWLLYYDLPQNAPVVSNLYLPLLFAFVLSVVSFIPLGQYLGVRLQAFREYSSALWGYSWDILGSFLGVVFFTFLSFCSSPPFLWFSVLWGLGSYFFRSLRSALLYLLCGIATLSLVWYAERATVYSPYYALARKQKAPSKNFVVLTNGSLHQYAMALQRNDTAETPEHAKAQQGYHLPYSLFGTPPQNALVLGAGTGNDVAVLLEQGLSHVDAVEIDPLILEWGKRFHPNQPYHSPAVTLWNTDARSFLHQTRNTYDLILFGTLDSMTRLSAHSNVRLDNFVYTRESLESAKQCLSPRGGLVLFFMVSTPYIDGRLTGLLTEVFQEAPLISYDDYGVFNRIYMAGPAFTHKMKEKRQQAFEEFQEKVLPQIEVPQDDWPYLYLKERGISSFYLTLILTLALFAVVSVFGFSAPLRQDLLQGKIDFPLFFLGMAFLLLETRSVTEMNLVWGATWLSSAIVFGSILGMVWLATLSSQCFRFSFTFCIVALLLSLLVAYFLPLQTIVKSSFILKLMASLLLVGTPIYFASLAFAELFRKRPHADHAFGWNILGAVAGGLIEFSSMLFGLKALLLLAVLLYLLTFAHHLRTQRGQV